LRLTELAVEDFDAVIGTNLRGVRLLARAEIRAMTVSGRRGSIVNTLSFVAGAATAGTSAYAASKAGLNALEVGPRGIRVNNVAPGVIRTPMSAGLSDDLYEAPLSAFRNGPISAWRGGPLKCAGVCV